MSAGKCKRGPENPLGATSSSSSGSDDDSPRNDVAAALMKTSPSSSAARPQSQTLRRAGIQLQQHPEIQQPSSSLSPAPAAAAHSAGLPAATLPIGSVTEQQDIEIADYDAASSPSGSSTLSGGSVYIRQPGFAEHAHTYRVPHSARRPRIKKKKNSTVHGIGGPTEEDVMVASVPASTTSLLAGATAVASGNGVDSSSYAHQQQQQQQQQSGLTSRQPAVRHSVVTRSKTHREPIPMRMRALPQSMWQEPNVPHNVSPATVYPVLPPLVTREGDDIATLRPVTPPEDRDELEPRSSGDKSIAMKATGAELRRQHLHSQQHGRHHQQLQPGERVITVANPELLMQLFDVLPKETPSKTGHRSYGNHGKKISSSKKVVIAPHFKTTLLNGHDPYLVDNIAESLFPQLSLERGGGGGGGGASTARSSGAYGSGTMMVHLQPLSVGDKTILLPSLSVDQNYPQMLSEVVANI